MILFLLFGFSLSSQNNLITNSSFDTGISDYAGINGASDEWFTINGDPNIAQTAEGTIHLKSNNWQMPLCVISWTLPSLLQVKATRFYLMLLP